MTRIRSSRKAPIPPRIAARMAELQDNARRAAGLLKAMSNSSRLVILCQLAEGERSVGELERAVGLSQSGISQHLAVLRREHVVKNRRERQTVYYSLASDEVVALMATLHKVFCASVKADAVRLKAA
ncbi:MAG TPA: metalloregulator ArsR/SmtB family transcription factor [Usitatibacter sp.]|nr:metalloregulator ArsR/SmtB family transcription factor [Usitatibacter sp.]